MKPITINKNNLSKYTELINKHYEVIHENNNLQISKALQRCFGNMHYCVQSAHELEQRIYN